MLNTMNKDIFGNALLDYYHNNYTVLRQSSATMLPFDKAQGKLNSAQDDIITSTNISDEDTLPLDYLFRNYNEMPLLEQKALKLSKGKVLDVGCGAGSHSLYLQNKGFEITAIDSSKGAIEVAKLRGVINTHHIELLQFKGQTFNTILLLMNGTGIFQELKQVSKYLSHLKILLNSGGQILIDSSDIRYMYLDEIDTSTALSDHTSSDLSDRVEELNMLNNGNYYGELDYYLSYKGEDELPMKWLYLDFNTLKTACELAGLKCEKVMDGEHYDYLARLS